MMKMLLKNDVIAMSICQELIQHAPSHCEAFSEWISDNNLKNSSVTISPVIYTFMKMASENSDAPIQNIVEHFWPRFQKIFSNVGEENDVSTVVDIIIDILHRNQLGKFFLYSFFSSSIFNTSLHSAFDVTTCGNKLNK